MEIILSTYTWMMVHDLRLWKTDGPPISMVVDRSEATQHGTATTEYEGMFQAPRLALILPS